jgi:hypothetical protein
MASTLRRRFGQAQILTQGRLQAATLRAKWGQKRRLIVVLFTSILPAPGHAARVAAGVSTSSYPSKYRFKSLQKVGILPRQLDLKDQFIAPKSNG